MFAPTPPSPPKEGTEGGKEGTEGGDDMSLFSFYYLGTLAFTYLVKQPWVAAGALLQGDAAHYKKELQAALKGPLPTGDGTQLMGKELRDRVDAVGELCDALVLNSRARYFESDAGVWNAESVEMFLTWSDDGFEEMLRGWDRPRKSPPTQAQRVVEVVDCTWKQSELSDAGDGLPGEEEAEALLHYARQYRIFFNGMRALGTDYVLCQRIKREA